MSFVIHVLDKEIGNFIDMILCSSQRRTRYFHDPKCVILEQKRKTKMAEDLKPDEFQSFRAGCMCNDM